MIAERNPAVATEVVDQLSLQEPLHGCLQELHDASVLLDMQGFQAELRDGKRPPAFGIRSSGHMAGSIGLLPLQTLVSGSCPCLLAKVLLVRPI